MSGRIRTIKPALLEDAVTAGLSDRAFRLFIAIILMADDHGRLRADPRFVRNQVYWATDSTLEAVTEAMAQLEPLVLFYDINGQRYAAIRNWDKHQKVSHPGKPRIPAPPESLPKPSGDPPDPPESLVPDLGSWSLDLGSGNLDLGPEGEPPDRRFSGGTTGVDARSRYESAMFAITKKPYGFQAKGIGTLCELLNTHARDEPTLAAALDWLERTLVEWVASADPQYTAGWSPAKLNDWINERNAPKRPVSFVRAKNADRQPHDEGWLKRMREREAAAGTGTDDPFGGNS